MLPRSPHNHFTNRCRVHSKLGGEALAGSAARVSRSDELNFCVVEPCLAVFYSSVDSWVKPRASGDRSAVASFGISIVRIIRWRPKPEMCRVHTGWIVAMVKNPKPFRDSAVMEKPREPVGHHPDSTDAETSVPTVVTEAHPNPALAKLWTVRRNRAVFVDLLKEPLLDGFGTFVDWCAVNGKTLGRFAHNVLSVMTGFSGAALAATKPRYDFTALAHGLAI